MGTTLGVTTAGASLAVATADVSLAVAAAGAMLRARLSDDEKAQAAAKPTQNADAYVFYLRANQISRNPDTLLEDYKTAEQLYMTESIALRVCGNTQRRLL